MASHLAEVAGMTTSEISASALEAEPRNSSKSAGALIF